MSSRVYTKGLGKADLPLPESVSCPVIFHSEIPMKEGANKYAHHSIIITPLPNISVTYVYVAPSTKPNTKTKSLLTGPLLDVPDTEIKGGSQSIIVSIRNVPRGLVEGGFAFITGLVKTTYKNLILEGEKKGEIVEGESMSITNIVMQSCSLASIKATIPFENRCFNRERDGYNPAESYGNLKDYFFLWVTINGDKMDNKLTEPNSLYGAFSFPMVKDEFIVPPEMLKFKPYDKEKETVEQEALTGGKEGGEMTEDAQFVMEQKDAEGRITVILGRCKVFDVWRFQMDWMAFAPVILPHLKGDLFARIDRKKTQSLMTGNADYALSLIVNTHPDMAEPIRCCGWKMSWNACLQLLGGDGQPYFAHPEAMDSNKFDPRVLATATAIDLLRYNGDITPVIQAAERGEIEFFVLAKFSSEELMKEMGKEPEEEIVKNINDRKLYTKSSEKVVAVWAVPTEYATQTVVEMLTEQRNKKR